MAIDVVRGYTNYGKPGGNTFMDISANMARTEFKASTDFSKMPQPGPHDRPIALFMDGHIGLLGNNGMAYESTPPCVRKYPWKGRGWKAWAYIPDRWLSFQDGVIRTYEEVVAIAETVIGMPYWYGCFGQAPTTELLRYKRKQYPSQYARIKSIGNYEGAIGKYAVVMDCIGLGRYVCLAKRVKISKSRPGDQKPVPPSQSVHTTIPGCPFVEGDKVRFTSTAAKYNPLSVDVPTSRRNAVYTVGQIDFPKNSGKAITKGGVLCVILKEIDTAVAVEILEKA